MAESHADKTNAESSRIFRSAPYEVFAADLDIAVAWIESRGVFHEKTRIAGYKRAIENLLNTYKIDDIERTRAEFNHFVTALFEANDLITIHKGLAGKYDEEIREQ